MHRLRFFRQKVPVMVILQKTEGESSKILWWKRLVFLRIQYIITSNADT